LNFKRIIFSIVFGLLTSFGFSQNYEIQGYAPDFVGEKVELFSFQDYVTMTKVKVAEAEVSPVDSLFHLKLENGATFKAYIQIGKTEAPLYVGPKSNYDIYFPAAENQPISFQNQRTDIVFFGLDTTDINYRILQYNQWFDSFVAYHEVSIARGQFLAHLDTFKMYAADAYQDVKDEYFLTYVRYNIGEMEQTFGGSSKSSLRLETFLNYIEPFPVYYENDQYMKFFRGFYSRGFEDYMPTIEAEINVAIEYASPTRLMSVLKQDLFLSNPEIRETVIIDQLGKQYYKRNDQKRNIIIMLDSLANYARYQVNATTAANVKSYLTSLEPGFPAPIISFKKQGQPEAVTWRDFQGKFVYLNFFETWNTQATRDMEIIYDLRQKYGEYVSFISVCTDKKSETFNEFMKAHPTFDWDIYYEGADSELKTDFRIKMVPTYFLIDQSGFIALAPAPTPSPDGEYESIDKTFFYIKKALAPVDYKRIGEP
jgi:hypothetical protein